MMSSWKQKLKEFSSGSRAKSPTANATNEVSSTKSSASSMHSIPSNHQPSPENDAYDTSLKTPIMNDVSAFGTSAGVNVEEEDSSRRTTITPGLQALNLDEDNNEDKSSNQASSNELSNQIHTSLKDSESSDLNYFKPGLLTVKIYHGSNIIIPFEINRDVNLLSKLQTTASDSSLHSQIANLLDKLNVESNNLLSLDNKDQFSSLIPANVTIPSTDIRNAMIYFTLEFDKTIISLDADSGTIYQPIFNKISQFDVTKPRNELKFQMFLRLPSILTELEDDTRLDQDVLISSKSITLNLDNIQTPVRIHNHDLVKFDNEYPGFSNLTNGELTVTIDFKPYHNKHLTIDDFDLLKVIGKGSFGKVMQVRKKDSGKIYALKAIRKSHIVSRSEVVHTLAERTVLAKVDNPFIVPLKFSFQSPEKLYLVLSFINGGELFYHLQKEGKFELQRSRLYTAELLSALECLHSLDVIYRDLKPENILLDYKGHIALCDFGLCKLNMKNTDKTKTFCGTPEYLAPELLLGNGYTKAVDWWTLGVLLYEMLTGLPPYYDTDVTAMYQRILKDPLKFPNGMDSDAKDLLIHLLARDPKIRLGTNGATEIKSHAFFKSIDWRRLNAKGYQPPFKPRVKDGFDTSNFDKEFTSEIPVDSVINDYLSESVQRQFGGWTYVGTENLGPSVKR